MKSNIKALIFGESTECTALCELMNQIELLADHAHEYMHVNDMEEFDSLLVSWQPTVVIVLANGAAGMESVYRSRQRLPDMTVFWFSDDQDFGMQSYRMDCAYFATKPATKEKIFNAIQRCKHIGIPYATA